MTAVAHRGVRTAIQTARHESHPLEPITKTHPQNTLAEFLWQLLGILPHLSLLAKGIPLKQTCLALKG